MEGRMKKQNTITVTKMTKIAILSAISYMLMFIAIPIPGLFPSFLKVDVSDIPAIFGGISLGPIAGFTIVFIKNLLQAITASTTAWIGEIANMLIGGSYIIVLSIIYRRKKDTIGLIIGFIIATIAMVIVGCLTNYYLLLPFYATIMPMDAIIQAGQIINPNITDLTSFVIWIIAPFNLFKSILMMVFALPLYKKMSLILNHK